MQGAYLASGYIYNKQNNFKQAVQELEFAVSLNNDIDLGLFLAIAKRRLQEQ